jgi:septum site-determining protein MinC
MRQKNLKVVEVEDFESLKKIIESKYFELVKNSYFLLQEPDEEIEEYLKSKGLSYLIKNSSIVKNDVKVVERIVEKIKEVKVDKKSVIYDRIIRSGEEIISEDTLIFLQRINPGTRIETQGSAIILDECHGSVIVDGEFLILMKEPKGTILFKGEEIKEAPVFISDRVKKVLK